MINIINVSLDVSMVMVSASQFLPKLTEKKIHYVSISGTVVEAEQLLKETKKTALSWNLSRKSHTIVSVNTLLRKLPS